MLKANNSIPPPPQATKMESPFSPEALSKLSKLAARKNKGTSEPPKLAVQTNIAHFVHDVREHLPQHQAESLPTQHKPVFAAHLDNPAARSVSNPTNTDVSNVSNRSDLEALLKEKQQWLRAMHEDNEKMAKMLKVDSFHNFKIF